VVVRVRNSAIGYGPENGIIGIEVSGIVALLPTRLPIPPWAKSDRKHGKLLDWKAWSAVIAV